MPFVRRCRRDSSLAIARVNLSIALLYAQDLAGAAREATEAARLLPSAPQPPYILGLIARAENRTADALREFERVRQIDAADVGTSINLGQIHLEERSMPQAIAVLRPAAAAEPYNVTAAYNLGLALTRGGQADEGRRMLERVQALRSAGYAVTYGTGYLEQGRYAEAIASTGAEPDLVDTAVPSATFTPALIGHGSPAAGGRPRVAVRPPFHGRRSHTGRRARHCGRPRRLRDARRRGQRRRSRSVRRVVGRAASVSQRRSGSVDRRDIGVRAGSCPVTRVPIGCVAGDYDNDGRTDLFVLRYGASSLYHNDGGNRFSDVTRPPASRRIRFSLAPRPALTSITTATSIC